MSDKPGDIKFLRNGKQIGQIASSHPDSLDASWVGGEPPTEAIIEGAAGCQCTFFDDQQFRLDENALQVVLKVDGPVQVDVAVPRLSAADHPDGVYKGEVDNFSWILYKHAKSSWLQEVVAVAGTIDDIAAAIAAKLPGSSWKQYVDAGKAGIEALDKSLGGGGSANSQTDNISSVLFGSQNE